MFFKLSFLGGFAEQGRSCLEVQLPGAHLLVDCGVKKEYGRYYGSPPLLSLLEPESLDCVVLSHHHEDHSALIPALVKRGFKGPIYGTPPALEAAKGYWDRWAKIFEEDGRRIYTVLDAEAAKGLCRPLGYGRAVKVGEAEITLHPSGHALGSASVSIRVGDFTLVHMADVAIGAAVSLDPDLGVKADVLVLNAAYGDAVLPCGAQEVRFVKAVARTLERGGRALVPTTAVGRAQETLYVLYKHRKLFEGLGRVFLHVSARKGFELARKWEGYVKEEFTRIMDEVEEWPQYFSSPSEIPEEPAVILAPDLMLMRPPSSEIFRQVKDDPRSAVILTGYLAPGTLGRALADYAGAGAFEYRGEVVRFKCQIVCVELKMHLDLGENIYVAERVLKDGYRLILLHHGDEPKSTRLALKLMERFGPGKAFVPRPGSSLVLEV